MPRLPLPGPLAMLTAALAATPAASGPDVSDEIFYHFMPIAWRDSTGDQHRFGDFGGMTASLDYLQDLGVTGVWINPIFPSPAYHGYQHGPADEINPWFGTEQQFLGFVAAAHARGIRVYIDLVCYGISHNSVYYQSAYGDPQSPYDSWLAFTNSGNTQYQGYTFNTWNGDGVGFIHWDLRTPAARDLVIGWSTRWLDPNGDGDPSDGIDGYRLDHVWPQYNSGPDGWGYNIDDFWQPWKDALTAVKPDVFTFAEQADWESTGAPLLGPHDAAFTKPFEFAARDALSGETAQRLYEEMQRALDELPTDGRGTFLAILGDHDVDRLTSILGGDLNKAKAAAAILLTQPFAPVIYYGDEIGMLGTKGDYGSDANDIPMREPFKWNAVAGPPMTDYWRLNAQAYNNRYSQDNDGRSVQEQLGVAGSLLETYKSLIAARKANPALAHGRYVPVPNSSPRIWSFLRHEPGGQTALIAINVHGQTVNASLDLSDATVPDGSTTPRDVLTDATLVPITDANKHAYPISLTAYGYRILEADLIPPAEPSPPAGPDAHSPEEG